ncbi:MAG: glycine--tRNA ligase subunit beta [Sphingomonadaceae bacterium]|nr:glycine--tRNA ligase subunit beta [Sphingomonadaceae bacterium]
MPNFVLELLTEEIPARMQGRAADDLARLFGEALGKRGLSAGVECHVTPRRLALFARGLPAATEATREERRGPRADAPAGAVDGFLRSTGLPREALHERETPKGRFLYAMIETPGRATAAVLPEAVSEAVAALSWPKSMRWGAASESMDSPRWVRPLMGVVALLDDAVVPLTVLGVPAGRETRGHRFMRSDRRGGSDATPRAGPGGITIASAQSYAHQLREAHVILDAAERRRIIAEGAARAAAEAGLAFIPDEGLVAENAGLTEWPVPLLGRFDPAFLDVPREVIQLTMRTNQKYFACAGPFHHPAAPDEPPLQAERGQALAQGSGPIPSRSPLGDGNQPQVGIGDTGGLAPAFVCVANLEAPDGGATIVEGNRRVLAARLSDARFFWEQDLREWRAAAAGTSPLGSRDDDGLWDHFAPKLERVTFHEKLGSMRDKAERVAALAEWLVTSGAVRPFPLPGHAGEREGTAADVARLAAQAHRAALLAKCDLVSASVGEFPELQGLMGGHYALAAGEDPAVAAAVSDHYKPAGPSDAVPTDPVSVAVALADKLDSIVALFGAGERPTGSRDPLALRRAALGAVSLIVVSILRLRLTGAEREADRLVRSSGRGSNLRDGELLEFLLDRLKVQQREAGVRHDLVDAVFALGGEDDLVRLLARVRALQAFTETEDGRNLLAAYKRAANILRQASFDPAAEPQHNAIPGTGEEDPPVMVDDPDFAPVVAALAQADRTADIAAGSDHPAQAALAHALETALPAAKQAVEAERFEDAMAALARLRAPIDRFFDELMVNDPDPAIRRARLTLLDRFVTACHAVADFAKIEG